MTKRDLLSVAIRVVGVLLLLHCVEQLAAGVYTQLLIRSGTLQGFSAAQNAVATLTAFIILAAFGIVFLAYADAITRLIVRQDKEALMPDIGANQADWFCVATRVVGVVLLATGVPQLVSTVIVAAAISMVDTTGFGLLDKFQFFLQKLEATHLDAAAYTALAQMAVGAYLIWGAKHLTRLVFRDRRVSQVSE